MSPARHKSFFFSEELAALQRAFDAACAVLALSGEDPVLRERLGAVIFEIAGTGESDEAVLRAHAVRRFRALDAGRSGRAGNVAVEIFAPVRTRGASARPDP